MRTFLSTKELVAIIGGVPYDVLLIPRYNVVDVDYSKNPYGHPACKDDDPESIE